MKKLIILVCIIALGALAIPLVSTAQEPTTAYRIAVDNQAHVDYGLSYPVTYQFDIGDLNNARAYYKYSEVEQWVELPEKTIDDVFSGIEAVRFDYSNGMAYVSVGFDDQSNDIYVQVTNPAGIPRDVTFVSICEYYDDSTTAVVMTADDYAFWASDLFHEWMDACQKREIWATPGVITELCTQQMWPDLQNQVDEGYVEVASHSSTHQHTPYDDYYNEISGSKQDIIDRLALPWPYTRGSQEYVWAFYEPYGQTDQEARDMMASSRYLVDRKGGTIPPYSGWPEWNNDGLYDGVGYWVSADNKTSGELNASFDAVYSSGGTYLSLCHPRAFLGIGFGDETEYARHLDHIGGKADVWYVGLGAMYAYHYVQERGMVAVMPVTIQPTPSPTPVVTPTPTPVTPTPTLTPSPTATPIPQLEIYYEADVSISDFITTLGEFISVELASYSDGIMVIVGMR